MTFLHISLLAGGVLAVIPVVLHLLSQRPPKPITFPALRFVKQTVQTHQRSWQIRQWLLLAIRALVLFLMAFALARPTVHSDMLATWLGIGGVGLLATLATLVTLVAIAARKSWHIVAITSVVAGLLWLGVMGWGVAALTRGATPPAMKQDAPVAAVIIVDTGPVMEYRYSNQTRLELAKEKARELIQRLPAESKIAIVTQPSGQFALDRTTALRQLDRVELQFQASNLPQLIQWGVQLVRSDSLERREVYVITDLSVSGWSNAEQVPLKDLLATEPQVMLQIIDVGLESPQNWSVGDLVLSQAELAPGGSVVVETTVSRTESTPGERVTAELLLEKNDPNLPVIRDGKLVIPEATVLQRQFADLSEVTSGVVKFEIRDLPQGLHHYRLRVERGDPLTSDDIRFLTLDVGEIGKVLVLGPSVEARSQLATILSVGGSEAIEEADLTSLKDRKLESYEVIVLQDPKEITEGDIKLLEKFVQDGGGLFIVLGPNLGSGNDASTSPLVKILPGKAARVSRRSQADRSVYLVPERAAHPLFQYFGGRVAEAPFATLPVFRHWELEFDQTPGVSKAQVLMRYSLSGTPAVVEESRGKGRILTWTTMVPEAGFIEGRSPWNELTSSADWWPTFGLLLGSVRYLAGATEDRVNYSVGQSAVLANPVERYPEQYMLFTPRGDASRIDVRTGSILIPTVQNPGVYRLRGISQSPISRGFSVNTASESANLNKIARERLVEIVGEENCRIAKDMSEVQQSVGAVRYGRELFPFMILLVCGLLIGEQWMANRFYQWNPGSKSGNDGRLAKR